MKRRKMILVAILLVVIIAALGLSVRAATRRPKLEIPAPPVDDDPHSFLVDPTKLGSPDTPGDWQHTDPELLRLLALLSKEVGRKLEVNSGHRSHTHNEEIGGVSDSAHLTYKAVDLHAGNPEKALALAKAAAKVGFQRIGVGRTFVHVDVDYSKNYPTAWGKEYYSTSPYSKAQLMPLLFP